MQETDIWGRKGERQNNDLMRTSMKQRERDGEGKKRWIDGEREREGKEKCNMRDKKVTNLSELIVCRRPASTLDDQY